MGALPKAGNGAEAYIMQILQRPGLESASVLSRTFLIGLLSKTEPSTMEPKFVSMMIHSGSTVLLSIPIEMLL